MSGRFHETDNGYKQAMRALRDIGREGRHVTIGIHDRDNKKHRNSKLSVAALGAVHEFGTDTIPRRSFLRDTIEVNKRSYLQDVERALSSELDGEQRQRSFTLLGKRVTNDVKQRIFKHISPPNAPATVARKGDDVPLIETGMLVHTIDYYVAGT